MTLGLGPLLSEYTEMLNLLHIPPLSIMLPSEYHQRIIAIVEIFIPKTAVASKVSYECGGRGLKPKGKSPLDQHL